MDSRTILGCDVLLNNIPKWLFKARTGILCHQASVTSNLRHVAEELAKARLNIKCIFSPQHGFFSEKQANMIESQDIIHPILNVPVHSLYGPIRTPTEKQLKDIDVLIIDLQDVGTRVYTYTTTMGLSLESAAVLGKKVIVLDRPNPLGTSEVEGNIVSEEHVSFVGRYKVPMRHGLTVGEYAIWVKKEKGLDLDLHVVKMQNWISQFFYDETGLSWVFPSPNMPTIDTAIVYPGMVLLEGTNISEGRGTTLPFLLFGAPFIDPFNMKDFINLAHEKYGVTLRPLFFEPMFDKWAENICGGFQIHVIDRKKFKPYSFGLFVISNLLKTYPESFSWKNPPYEYEYEQQPIDILIGNRKIREMLERGNLSLEEIEGSWQEELHNYLEKREDCRLY